MESKGATIILFLILCGIGLFVVGITDSVFWMCIAGALLFGLGVFIIVSGVTAHQKNQSREIQVASDKERNEADQQEDIANLSGLDKYEYMHHLDIQNHQEGVRAIRMIGSMIESSVYQESEKDWAIHGGIAQGLGGPIAGIATAINIESENQEIRKRNEDRKQWAQKQKSEYEHLARQAEENKPVLMSRSQINAKYAAVFKWSPNTLFQKLRITKTTLNQNPKTGSLKVSVNWEQKDHSLCIDGSLRAKIYDSSYNCVGCAYLNFPTNGSIEYKGVLNGICCNLPIEENYTISLEPADLWELTLKEFEHLPIPENLTKEQHIEQVKLLRSNYEKERGN